MAPDAGVERPEGEVDDGQGDEPPTLTRTDAVSEEQPACQWCRKKKSRCSREQPCSQCVKSGVDCIYDDKRSKGGIKTGVIERLTQRIDAIENMFLGQGVLLQQLLQARDDGPQSFRPSVQPALSFMEQTDRMKHSLSALGSDARVSASDQFTLPSSAMPKRKRDAEVWISKKRGAAAAAAAGVEPSTSMGSREALPAPRHLEVVLETYFKLIHPWIPVLHPSTFLRKARENPRSPAATLILHAIVAVAGHHAAEAASESTEGIGDLRRHASTCRDVVLESAVENGSLGAIQALILIAFDTIKRGLSQSPWSLVAMICRKVEELQLNCEETAERDSLSDYFVTVPPSLDAARVWIEVEEQRRVFWATFLLDRFCSTATRVNPCISSKTIRRRLPCDGYMWELDQAVETSFFKMHEQTSDEAAIVEAESPFPPAFSTTATTEGPSGIGGLAYTIEATESLHLMTKFHTRHSLDIENSTQLSKWLNNFRQLDSRLLQWELCLTHRWREVRVVDGYIDPNLTLAHMTHNAAIIVLHQKLAYPPPGSRAWLSALVSAASREACVMAAFKINKIARRYLDASNGIPPHQFMYCLYLAGRLLLAQAAHQATKSLAELGSTIASLHEVSQRLDHSTSNVVESTQPENPAARFACSLIEQRDVPAIQGVPTLTTAANGEAEEQQQQQQQPQQTQNIQFPPGLIDIPTMLQQYGTSPSSGISLFGLNAPEAAEPSSGLVDDNVLALTQSLLPSARIAHNLSAYQARLGGRGNRGEQEFDFIAELRRFGRAQENEQASGESQPATGAVT